MSCPRTTIERAKWTYDGSLTIDDMIQRLKWRIEWLESMKADGWTVAHKVDDDYAYLERRIDGLECDCDDCDYMNETHKDTCDCNACMRALRELDEAEAEASDDESESVS